MSTTGHQQQKKGRVKKQAPGKLTKKEVDLAATLTLLALFSLLFAESSWKEEGKMTMRNTKTDARRHKKAGHASTKKKRKM